MATGAGKYDGLCSMAREAVDAEAVILIVFNGALGSGFSMQAPMDMTLEVASLLETLAKQIRAGTEKNK